MSDFKKKMEEKYPVPERLSPENIVNLIEEKKASDKRKKIGLITGITSVAACCAIVGAVALSNPSIDKENDKSYISDFEASEKVDGVINLGNSQYHMSYKDIYNILNDMYEERQERYDYYYGDVAGDMWVEKGDAVVEDTMTNESVQEETAPPKENAGDNKDFYETYQQVEGVAEADVIKTDGKFIYYLSGNYIYVIDLNGEVLNKTSVSNTKCEYLQAEMFLVENKLVYMYSRDYGDSCSVDTYEISEGGKLTLGGSFTQEGQYITSRLIGDKLYMVSYKNMYDFKDAVVDKPVTYIPTYEINDKAETVKAENVVINNASEFYGYAVISQVDINSIDDTIVKTTFTNSPTVYCNKDNIYLISNFNKYEMVKEKDFSYYTSTLHCYVTRFSVKNNLALTGRTIIDGFVKDQFSADEYDGYFRIAVRRDVDNALYVFDKNFKLCSCVGDMGKGEQIKSVSFEGDKAYIVTFRQTDPLYTIDLSNPEKPVILDELKISGFSTHLRRFKDNLLLGFGNEADERNGIVTGIKLSMFEEDESGKQTEIAKVVISAENDSVYYYVDSPATSDHKYLLINSEKNIIGFPYTAYGEYVITDEFDFYKEYKTYSDNRYNIYNFTGDGFEELCSIEVSDTNARAIYIEDVIYILCEDNIYLVDMNSGELLKENKIS